MRLLPKRWVNNGHLDTISPAQSFYGAPQLAEEVQDSGGAPEGGQDLRLHQRTSAGNPDLHQKQSKRRVRRTNVQSSKGHRLDLS